MRELLIREIEAELDYLINTIYSERILLPTISPQWTDIKELHKTYKVTCTKDLTITQLKYITRKTIYEGNEEDLYDNLIFELENSKTLSQKRLLELLPIFKALLNSNNIDKRLGALRLYMDIHCSKDFEFNKNKEGQRIFAIIEGLDHILGTKESAFDINSAIMVLNYINMKKDSLRIPEYRELLEVYYNKLYPFIDFYTTKDFMTRLNSHKQIKLTQEDMCKDNENLIKFFINCDIPRSRNSYYVYRYLDELVKNHPSKSISNMIRFCYADLSPEKFKEMPNIDITFGELQNFINSYELAGNRFSTKQIERLLINYRKNYLNNNSLIHTYFEEVELVKAAYQEYNKEHFAYTSIDFVTYFNKKYKYSFKCFSFDGKETLLTTDIFNEVINGRSSLLEKVDCLAVSESFSVTDNFDDELSLKRAKEAVYEKYYDILLNYLYKKDVTLEYFIRENVSRQDEMLFRELLDWHCTNNNCSLEVSDTVKAETAELIIVEALKEQEMSPLDERDKIFEKYKGYLASDNLESFCGATKLGRIMNGDVKDRLAAKEEGMVADIKLAIANSTSLLDVAEKYEVLIKDLEAVIKKHFNTKDIKDKLKAERELRTSMLHGEFSQQKKEQAKQKWQGIIADLLSSNERIDDFCRKYNKEHPSDMISPQRIMHILRHSDYFDEQYANDCIDKIVEEKIGHQTLENKETIMLGIHNGIESDNGKRNYTLFDLFMIEGAPIRLDDVKFELLNRNPYLDTVGYVKTKIFIDEAITKYGALFPYNTQERTFNIDELTDCDFTYVVGDEPHHVTEEEKQVALDFINASGFPKQMYLDALAAHVKGEYDLPAMIKAVQYKKEVVSVGGINE